MQDVVTKDYLDLTRAKDYIKHLTNGIEIPSMVLHTAVSNKKIRAVREKITDPQKRGTRTFNRETEVLYNAEDIRKLTAQFLELKGDLLTVEEAYKAFLAERPTLLSLEQFRNLVLYHNVPTVDATLWYQQLFSRERVQAVARSLSDKQLETMLVEDATLFTMQEAVAYLQQRWPDREIKEQTLYHMVARNQLIPAVRPPKGTIKKAYRLTKSSLDAIGGIRAYERIQHVPEPVNITDSTVMEELIKRYGKLIATPLAVKIVRQKLGRDIDTPTITQHLRKHVGPVGVARVAGTSTRGHLYYYAEKDVEAWVAQPARGQKIAARNKAS